MISIQAKKHDNFSIEFKCGFNCTIDGVADDFAVNAWIFVPNSLDINPENYGKSQFYRDIKSNVRLITPVYSLRELADEAALPLSSVTAAINTVIESPTGSNVDTYEYHLKMFAAIFKSALRDQTNNLMCSCSLPDTIDLVIDYADRSRKVLSSFRSLYQLIDSADVPARVKNSFRMCDEFMTHVLDVRTMRLIKLIDSFEADVSGSMKRQLVELLNEERIYRQSVGYRMLKGDSQQDVELVHHYGMLKKFTESELYIKLDKKKDGVAVQQIYYSLAAGVAMVFATAVSWHYQQRYGSVTLPLFVALVISYMLKDRIKDLLRYYFAHKLGNKYYDKKAHIAIGKIKVGAIKEGFDFVSETKMPAEVRSLREKSSFVEGESGIFEEKILLYRQRLTLDENSLAVKDKYLRQGVNEILRLHLNRFTHKMDNPLVSADTMDEEGNILQFKVPKLYYINIVFQLVHDGVAQFRQFRIGMNRDGIHDIEKI